MTLPFLQTVDISDKNRLDRFFITVFQKHTGTGDGMALCRQQCNPSCSTDIHSVHANTKPRDFLATDAKFLV